jgi:hypothetical protein
MLIRVFIMCVLVAGFAVGFAEIVSYSDEMSRPERSAMTNCTTLNGGECGGLLRVR